MDNKEAITLRNGGELKELKREEVDANELKELVKKEEEESTSPEPNEMRKEVVETFLEMILWGEMHEELQNEKMTPMFKVDEYIVQLNKKLEDNIVKQKEKNFKKMSMKNHVLKLLIEHNYCLLGKDGGQNHQPIRS